MNIMPANLSETNIRIDQFEWMAMKCTDGGTVLLSFKPLQSDVSQVLFIVFSKFF